MFDEDAKAAIVQALKEIPTQYVGKSIQLQDEANLTNPLVTGDDRFEVVYEANMEGGLKREVKAHFGKSLLIEDKETNVMIHQVDLENVVWAAVRCRFHKPSTLSLGLPFGRVMKFRLGVQEIAAFLTNVVHSNDCPLLIDFSAPEMKILCDVDGEIDPGFEASLAKKIEDGLPDLPKTFNQGLFNALLTGSINLSFASTGYDLKLVGAFADALKRLAKFIESSEADPEMVKEFQDFTSSPSKSKQPKRSLGNFGIERSSAQSLLCVHENGAFDVHTAHSPI